jgi:hypothetical protein
MVDFSDPAFAALAWDTSHRGARLDLTGYHQTFRDDFNDLSISGSDGTGTRWFSPARAGYGGAAFKEYVPPPSQPVRQISAPANSPSAWRRSATPTRPPTSRPRTGWASAGRRRSAISR